MLVMTPLAAKMQRKLARQENATGKDRLGRRRFETCAADVAEVIRLAHAEGATSSLFGLEGPLRHGIRSDLCLQGWRWAVADATAKDVVDDALRRVGAVRPRWKEGQPEWTDAGVIRDTRLRCAQCDAPLEIGQKAFCSRRCADSHRARLAYQDNIETARALQRLRSRKRRARCATS